MAQQPVQKWIAEWHGLASFSIGTQTQTISSCWGPPDAFRAATAVG